MKIFLISMLILAFTNSNMKQALVNRHSKATMSEEEKGLLAAHITTLFFQAKMEQFWILSPIERASLERFLRNILQIRNDAYQTPQFWYLRQGRK